MALIPSRPLVGFAAYPHREGKMQKGTDNMCIEYYSGDKYRKTIWYWHVTLNFIICIVYELYE